MARFATVAEGLAAVALLATAAVIGYSLSDLFSSSKKVSPLEQKVCTVPIEVSEGNTLQVGCASDALMYGCEAHLRAGDRIELSKDPKRCLVISHGMTAGTRLLVGLPVDLNRSSAAELELVDGIGPSLAKQIVEDRNTQGPFLTVDDLNRVKGVGEQTLARLKPLLTVE